MSSTTPRIRRQSTPIQLTPNKTPRRIIGNSAARIRGTPVEKVLASEGINLRSSPRRIRKIPFTQKVLDIPNTISQWIEDLILDCRDSMDRLGYTLAITLHALHLLTRHSVFTALLPALLRNLFSKALPSARLSNVGDANARLQALRGAEKVKTVWFGWVAFMSLLLLGLSCWNAYYLFTRKRSYYLNLQTTPIATTSAHTTNLEFHGSPPKVSPKKQLKNWAFGLFSRKTEEEKAYHSKAYPIQQLDVWVPEHFIWSVRVFVLYPPPIAMMYYFLTPANLIGMILSGLTLIGLLFAVMTGFITTVADRQIIATNVMREYNTNFVHPRTSKSKREMGVQTSNAEPVHLPHWENETVDVIRGSGRKSITRARLV